MLCGEHYYPATGQWLTRDPIGYKGGINRYSCVGNNTIIEIDSKYFAEEVRGSVNFFRGTAETAIGPTWARIEGPILLGRGLPIIGPHVVP